MPLPACWPQAGIVIGRQEVQAPGEPLAGANPAHSRVDGLLELPNSGKNPANVVEGSGFCIGKVAGRKEENQALPRNLPEAMIKTQGL